MITQMASDENTRKANRLLQQGYAAYNNWDIEKARLCWRRAATLDPANEDIWIALSEIIRDDEDRRVCLQNILVLNPDNQDAEKRLRLLENETQPSEIQEVSQSTNAFHLSLGDRLKQIFSWILTAIITFVVGVLLFSILIQPFV